MSIYDELPQFIEVPNVKTQNVRLKFAGQKYSLVGDQVLQNPP